MASQARGLHNFIADIRNCASKEAEQQRVDRELANIRAKFSGNPGSLNSYHRKKYVWKLVYINMLGYDIDFGHMEMIGLLNSAKYSEKSVGYMAVSLLLRPDDNMMTLVVNSLRQDLLSQSSPAQTLALAAVANLGGNELAESVSGDVQRLLTAGSTSDPSVKKKAALCLLRLFRTNPDCLELVEWADRLATLLEDRHLGVLTSVMSLLLGFASTSAMDFQGLVPYVVHILSRLSVQKACSQDYLYYSTPSPWLQVKCLRFLQYYAPPEDTTQRTRLDESLGRIIAKTDSAESVNKSNADHAVLFEAVNLIIAHNQDANERLRQQALALLGKFISVRDGNIRYLGLEAMSRLARIDGPKAIQKYQNTVLVSLKDADISVRRRALDLLFVMCDADNALTIVRELITYLNAADMAIKDEMVLKIAILAEKFADNLNWYVDTMVKIISVAGDFVSDEIWHRIVQIVTNHKDLQQYAAGVLFTLVASKRAHETGVMLAGYILGEFGFLVAEEPGKSGEAQFDALHQHFPRVSVNCRSLLISTYAKFMNLYPELRPKIEEQLRKYSVSGYVELQQRSVEYMNLPLLGDEVMEEVLREMPEYPDTRESPLERRLREPEAASTDRSVWVNTRERADSDNAAAGGDAAGPTSNGTSAAAAASGVPSGAATAGNGAAEAAAAVDLLSLDDDTTDAGEGAAAPGSTVGLTQEIVPQLRSWFTAAVAAPQAVLFENDVLQVGVKHEYQQARGRMALFFGNRSDAEMTNFSATVPEVSFFQVQVQPAAVRITVGDQARLQLIIDCMQPSTEAAQLVIGFDLKGAHHEYPLRLPVVASNFFEPVVLEGAAFMQRWQGLDGPEREVQEVFDATTPISSEEMARIRSKISGGLRMGIAQGIDQTEFTVTASSMMHTAATSADGKPVVIGCMTRIEASQSAQKYRVTVRAVHGTVAQAACNVIKGQILA